MPGGFSRFQSRKKAPKSSAAPPPAVEEPPTNCGGIMGGSFGGGLGDKANDGFGGGFGGGGFGFSMDNGESGFNKNNDMLGSSSANKTPNESSTGGGLGLAIFGDRSKVKTPPPSQEHPTTGTEMQGPPSNTTVTQDEQHQKQWGASTTPNDSMVESTTLSASGFQDSSLKNDGNAGVGLLQQRDHHNSNTSPTDNSNGLFPATNGLGSQRHDSSAGDGTKETGILDRFKSKDDGLLQNQQDQQHQQYKSDPTDHNAVTQNQETGLLQLPNSQSNTPGGSLHGIRLFRNQSSYTTTPTNGRDQQSDQSSENLNGKVPFLRRFNPSRLQKKATDDSQQNQQDQQHQQYKSDPTDHNAVAQNQEIGLSQLPNSQSNTPGGSLHGIRLFRNQSSYSTTPTHGRDQQSDQSSEDLIGKKPFLRRFNRSRLQKEATGDSHHKLGGTTNGIGLFQQRDNQQRRHYKSPKDTNGLQHNRHPHCKSPGNSNGVVQSQDESNGLGLVQQRDHQALYKSTQDPNGPQKSKIDLNGIGLLQRRNHQPQPHYKTPETTDESKPAQRGDDQSRCKMPRGEMDAVAKPMLLNKETAASNTGGTTDGPLKQQGIPKFPKTGLVPSKNTQHDGRGHSSAPTNTNFAATPATNAGHQENANLVSPSDESVAPNATSKLQSNVPPQSNLPEKSHPLGGAAPAMVSPPESKPKGPPSPLQPAMVSPPEPEPEPKGPPSPRQPAMAQQQQSVSQTHPHEVNENLKDMHEMFEQSIRNVDEEQTGFDDTLLDATQEVDMIIGELLMLEAGAIDTYYKNEKIIADLKEKIRAIKNMSKKYEDSSVQD